MMRGGIPPEFMVLTDDLAAALADRSIFVGGGRQDPIHAVGFRTFHLGPALELKILTAAGIAVTPNYVNGGHNWYVWRLLLKDFLTGVAFKPLPGATWPFPSVN